jgi:hypothetical protein
VCGFESHSGHKRSEDGDHRAENTHGGRQHDAEAHGLGLDARSQPQVQVLERDAQVLAASA